MNLKKREISRAVIVIIFIILAVVIIKCVQGCDATKKALQKKGYSKEDILTITDKLDEQTIKSILELDKQDKLASILNEKYYIPDNLMTYLEQSKNDKSIQDIISTVNVGSYNNWYTNAKEADVSKGITMLVNKFHYLKEDYDVETVPIPTMYAYTDHHITKEVYNQYVKMWNAANKEDITLIVNSSYRTYKKQQQEYNASNDDYAARPGYSEHQTGLALDIVTTGNIIGNQFEETEAFRWLQNNAHKYGFILRYPKDKEYITGYAYESWHYRYVGVDMANKVKESGLTYDEYYAYYCEYKKEC